MISDRAKNLVCYIPGEQPKDKKYIKLNTNENPYPPSNEVIKKLTSYNYDDVKLYPDPNCSELKNRIADYYRVCPNNIFVGNGSDEILSLIFYTFFDNKKGPLLFPEFTYSFYPVYADFYSISTKKIKLKDDWSINIDNYLNEKSCGIIFPNPNAPTGIYLSLDEVKKLLNSYDKNSVVVIDEAYIDFGGESAVSLINDYKNLLVVKTFSKSRSLAGLRLGYAIGDKFLIENLENVKNSFNSYTVNRLTQVAGIEAIKDSLTFNNNRNKIINTREKIVKELENRGWKILPSLANFIFAKPNISASECYKILKDNGVLVRFFNKEKIDNFLRITIGTDKEMETFLSIVDKLCL